MYSLNNENEKYESKYKIMQKMVNNISKYSLIYEYEYDLYKYIYIYFYIIYSNNE